MKPHVSLSTCLDEIAAALRTHYGHSVDVGVDDTVTGQILVWNLRGGLLAEVAVPVDGTAIGTNILDAESMTDVAGRPLTVTIHDEPTVIAGAIAKAIDDLLPCPCNGTLVIGKGHNARACDCPPRTAERSKESKHP